MTQLPAIDWIEAIGWIASILTVATYAVNTMLVLRVFAIGSSVFFLIYASILGLWPLLVMEAILLPLNCFRLWQIVSLRGRVRRGSASTDSNFAIIKRYGKPRRIDAGSVIFERGDPGDRLYYIDAGTVMIEEFGSEISAGEIFGEIAFFTEAGTRTATARCVEDAQVFELDEKRFMRLQFEDPHFGLSVIRTVTRRLLSQGNPA